jgi:Tfp pilus assembly ATPase PilU
MIGTPAIRNLIREGQDRADVLRDSDRPGQGMQTLDQCLQELVPRAWSAAKRRATRRKTRTASDMEREQAIRLMQDLLRRMVEKKGSDLFITAGFPPAIKVDGEIRPQSDRSA